MDGGCDRLAAMVDGSDEILSFSHELKEKDDGVICIGKYSGLQTTVPTEDLPASFSTVEGLGE